MAKTAKIQLRTTSEIKEELMKKAKDLGFSSLTEYMIFAGLNAEVKVTVKKK